MGEKKQDENSEYLERYRFQQRFYKSEIKVGSKTYLVPSLELGSKFDKKVLLYPNGSTQTIYANSRVFKVPSPKVVKKAKSNQEAFVLSDDEKAYREQREDNIQRAKARIKQIVLCNEWDYFITLTFDDEKIDASNADLVLKKSQTWLKNLTARKGIGYLLIPEYHKDGKRIHFHALIKGALELSFDDVYAVKGYDKPVKLQTIKRRKISLENIQYKVYNVKGWQYGHSTAVEVYGNPLRLANYVRKYMTKDIRQIFPHLYWVSRNLTLYPIIDLSNDYNYYNINAKEYKHGMCDVGFKYVDRTGTNFDELEGYEEILLNL